MIDDCPRDEVDEERMWIRTDEQGKEEQVCPMNIMSFLPNTTT